MLQPGVIRMNLYLMEIGTGALTVASARARHRVSGVPIVNALCPTSVEASMRTTLLATAILLNALVLGGTASYADQLTAPTPTVWQAPIGHLQPRAQQVSPNAPAEQAEQQRMSTYDAEQQKLDQNLDKRLNICRGC
jgi:hypothetical protein